MKNLVGPCLFLFICLAAACAGGGSPTPPLASPSASPSASTTPQPVNPPVSTSLPFVFPTDLAATLCPVPTSMYSRPPRPTEDAIPASARGTLMPGPSPTPTPTAYILPPVTPVSPVGFALPADPPAINLDNIQQLADLAHWGYGSIRKVAAAPDGSFLIVASDYGIARYSMQSLDTPPLWMPFSQPINLIDIVLSTDGRILAMQYWQPTESYHRIANRYYFDLTRQVFVQDIVGVEWSRVMQEPSFSSTIMVRSPDGSRLFVGEHTWGYNDGDEFYEQEGAVMEMYDGHSGQLLYTLTDPVQLVRYRDRAMPEACDLYVFSMCGNALAPVALSPYQAEFSLTGETFAVLYRASSLGNPRDFSTLRVYRLSDGRLLGQVGTFTEPVADFTYLPGQDVLLVGFVDGSIQLYDIPDHRVAFSARHFQLPIWYLTYSYNGEYLVIQRPYEVEVRLARDGSLFGRYAATASAVSPVDNLLAYGTIDGSLVIQDMDTMQVPQRIPAHTALIYSVSFSPDGGQVISSGQDCAVRLWNAHSGLFLHPFEEVSVNAIGESWTESRIFLYNLNFVPGRNQVIGFGSWGTVASWNTNSGATQFVITSVPSYTRSGMITIHPQFPEWFGVDLVNDLFYVEQNSFSLLDGTLVGEYQPPAGLPEGCFSSGPLTSDGRLRFTLGYDSRDGQICVLDASSQELLWSIEVIPAPANRSFYLDWLYLSPDGTQLITSASAGVIYVYQILP